MRKYHAGIETISFGSSKLASLSSGGEARSLSSPGCILEFAQGSIHLTVDPFFVHHHGLA